MKPTGILLLIILCAGILYAGGGREKVGDNSISLSGRLSVKGNEPFSFLALTTQDNKIYLLEGEKTDNLIKLQGRGPVSISGIILTKQAPPGVEAAVKVLSYSF